MKIRKIHIDCFGKFENYDLELSDGMNVIYGQNEDGKSTLMAFILMVFYGYSGRSKDLSRNLREKYRPWNGKEMKGHILFEQKGILYRLERTFGRSNSSDKVKILDEITGETIKWANAKDPGQEFFGLGEEAFAKSVFIGQGGIFLDASGKKDEITEKLLNLVTTGSEDVSYKRALDTLTASMESLVSKSGKLGALVKAKEEMVRLKEERIEAERHELEKRDALVFIGQLKDRLSEEEAEERSQKEKLKVLEYATELDKLEEAITREEKLLQAEKEADREKEKLSTKEGILTEEKLIHLKGLLQEQEELSKKLHSEKERLERLQLELSRLKESPVKEVKKEDLEELKEKEDYLLRLREEKRDLQLEEMKLDEVEEIKKKRESLQQKHTQMRLTYHREKTDLQTKEASFLEHSSEKEKLEAQKHQLEEQLKHLQMDAAILEEKVRGTKERENEELLQGERRIKDARMRLEDAEKPRRVTEETEGRRAVHMGMAVMAFLTAAGSILLGALLEPYYYGGLLLAGILAMLSYRKSRAVERVVEKIDESLVIRYQDELKMVQMESEERRQELKEILQELQEKLEEQVGLKREKECLVREAEEGLKGKDSIISGLKKNLEEKVILTARLEEGLAGIEEDLKEQEQLVAKEESENRFLDGSRLHDKITETDRDIERTEKERKDFLERFQVDTYEHLLNLHHLYNAHLSKISEKMESLNTESEAVSKLENSLEEIQKRFIEELSDIREVEGNFVAVQVLKELEEALAEYGRLNRHADYLRSERKPLEMSMTREALHEKREALRGTIVELLGADGYSEKALQKIRQGKEELGELERRISILKEDITKKEAELKEKYRHKKNISQIDDALDFYKEKVAKRQKLYDALTLAKEQLENAFQELQRSFGPKVNEKTEKIFQRLTDGKYQKVRVAKDFSISVEDPERKSSYEWGFLSGGTIDQAYLSLRLAITELMMAEGENLPIFLDDVFTQYDDDRAYEGLQFLKDYALKKEDPIQVVLFTCHRRLHEWAINLGDIVATQLHKT